MINIDIIKDLTNAFGPAGFEDDAVEVIKHYCKDMDVESDALLNVFARLKGNTGKKPVVMLDAHIDEVGFMVQYINPKGQIGFVNMGGWITSNIPAHTVKIKNSKGELITGIITSKPPHFMSAEEKNQVPPLESLMIDVGASSAEEVLNVFGIQVGDPIVPDVSFQYNEKNDTMLAKGLDNRLGCMCIIETLNALKDCNDLPVDVVGAFAVQEEIGTRGAVITSQVVDPDLAIVFEGSPADDSIYESYQSQCALKKGTQIRHLDASYVSNPEYIRFAKKIADAKNIKYQSAVRRAGSTNAGRIHLSHKATPCLVLGIPSRYAHTHYCYCAKEDIQATVDMAVEVIQNLNEEIIQKIKRQK